MTAQDRKKVIGVAFVLACLAALFGAAVLSLLPDPVWRGQYFAVWEFGKGEPGVDDYFDYDISADGLKSRISPYYHFYECFNHECFKRSGDYLIISDDIMALTLHSGSPYFTANITKFCYYDVQPDRSAPPNWRNDHPFFGLADTSNVTIYDKDGEVVFQGGETTVNLDPPLAYAIYLAGNDVTVAVAYDAPEGALLQVRDGIFSMFDNACGLGDASYPVTIYYGMAKGEHPEFAYDVYCMAFGGCTPNEPQYPQWEIDWGLVLLVLILFVVLLLVLS